MSLPILAYAPLLLQRRLPEGIWVAMIVLVMIAIEHWQVEKKNRILVVCGLLCVSTMSTIILWSGGLQAALVPGIPHYIPADQAKAFEFLATNARRNDVVLAAYDTGNALPAWTPQFVMLGHGSETAHFAEIKRDVADFFDAQTTEKVRLRLLSDFYVDYIAWGPAERSLGDWNPRQAEYLEMVYAQGEYAIFKVILP
jgi:hypothetical protein